MRVRCCRMEESDWCCADGFLARQQETASSVVILEIAIANDGLKKACRLISVHLIGKSAVLAVESRHLRRHQGNLPAHSRCECLRVYAFPERENVRKVGRQQRHRSLERARRDSHTPKGGREATGVRSANLAQLLAVDTEDSGKGTRPGGHRHRRRLGAASNERRRGLETLGRCSQRGRHHGHTPRHHVPVK